MIDSAPEYGRLKAGINSFTPLARRWRPFDPVAIRRHAVRFSRARFGDEMEAHVQAC